MRFTIGSILTSVAQNSYSVPSISLPSYPQYLLGYEVTFWANYKKKAWKGTFKKVPYFFLPIAQRQSASFGN